MNFFLLPWYLFLTKTSQDSIFFGKNYQRNTNPKNHVDFQKQLECIPTDTFSYGYIFVFQYEVPEFSLKKSLNKQKFCTNISVFFFQIIVTPPQTQIKILACI